MMAYALRDKVEQLGLVEVRMALDLQHGWADAGVGNDVINLMRVLNANVIQQHSSDLLAVEVGQSECTYKPGIHKLLQCSVRLKIRRVACES